MMSVSHSDVVQNDSYMGIKRMSRDITSCTDSQTSYEISQGIKVHIWSFPEKEKNLLCPYMEISDVINPRPKMRMLGYPLMPIYGDPQASNQGPNSPRPCLALLTYVLCPYMEIPILSILRTLLRILCYQY